MYLLKGGSLGRTSICTSSSDKATEHAKMNNFVRFEHIQQGNYNLRIILSSFCSMYMRKESFMYGVARVV